MNRRAFLEAAGTIGVAPLIVPSSGGDGLRAQEANAVAADRGYWVAVLTRLADPVLKNLVAGTLKARMPVEQATGANRAPFSHLEALGRLIAGIAPWLELPADDTPEGKLRAQYGDLARRAIARAVDPASPDFLNFTGRGQPLVDAAFLAQGVLRAPRALRESLDATTQKNLVAALESTRGTTPGFNNWLLFSATVEAALARLGATWDRMRVDYALRQHEQWYKGDGVYGDGPTFHWDYYNSFVIQPMLLDVLDVCRDELPAWKDLGDAGRAASTAVRGHPRAPDRAGRQLPANRPLDRLSIRRLPAAGADGAAKVAARGDHRTAGSWRALRDHQALDRDAGNLRQQRLAADRIRRPSAGRGGDLHFNRQPLPVRRWSLAARPAGERSVLVGARRAVDIRTRLVRSAVSDR